jgi:hypothetical protein
MAKRKASLRNSLASKNCEPSKNPPLLRLAVGGEQQVDSNGVRRPTFVFVQIRGKFHGKKKIAKVWQE